MNPAQGTAAPWARRWAPALVWAAVILVLTSIPNVRPPIQVGYSDKLAHFGVYAILGILSARAMLVPRMPPRLLQVFLALAVFAAADEVHQLWMRNRDASPFDWLADVVGVSAGLLSYHLLTRAPHAPRTSTPT